MTTILLALLVLLAAAVGFLVGISYTVRTWKRHQATAAPPAGTRSVPINTGPACEQCRANFPDWFCWLGGCP